MTGLVAVGGGHWLAPAPAAAYAAMLAGGCPPGITSSTRTVARQQEFYDHQGQPGWPATADHPARSKHVWRPDDPKDQGARALDLPPGPEAWVRAWGAPYGWLVDQVHGEHWHVEHEPTTAQEDDVDLDDIKTAMLELMRCEEFRQRMKRASLEAIAQSGVPTAAGTDPQALADAIADELADRLKA
jgi:hypothetical protein